MCKVSEALRHKIHAKLFGMNNLLIYFNVILFLKIVTWANICCQSFFFFFFPEAPQYIVVYSSCRSLWLCCVGCHLSMAWWVVLGPRLGSEPAKPWATKAEHRNLTTRALGQSPGMECLKKREETTGEAAKDTWSKDAKVPWKIFWLSLRNL